MLQSSSSGTGGRSEVCIAVLDGPVDISHRCFQGSRLEILGDAVVDPRSPATAHGTHVASIIFGQPGSEMTGLAPFCRGICVPIFSGGDTDGPRCSQLDLARALLVALDRGAHIINVSGGQLRAEGEIDAFLVDALRKCEEQGALVIAAAGNDGSDVSHVPACMPTVLAVGAADKYGEPLGMSNWGSHYKRNGILAPGEDIPGAAPGGGLAVRTGTSFATPIVTGFAARLLAEAVAAGGGVTPIDIRGLLIRTAIRRSRPQANADTYLAGGLNIAGATAKLNGGRAAMTMSESAYELAPSHESGGGERLAEAEAGRPGESALPGRMGPPPHASALAPMDAAIAIGPSHCNCGGESKDCGCGCGGAKKQSAAPARPQLVYALGQLGVDFGSEARRDAITQFMGGGSATNNNDLIEYLNPGGGAEINPEVERITWTLNLDQTPIYAIQPVGAFAFNGYAQILSAFRAQNEGAVGLFAVPGTLSGTVRLMSGETVPLLLLSAKGITRWDLPDAVATFIRRLDESLDKKAAEKEKEAHERRMNDLRDRLPGFLGDFANLFTRKYRNLGIHGRERALNFASTSAIRAFQIVNDIGSLGLVIDDISVEASAACRPGSECYDVRLKMFRPSDITSSLRIYQFTLDVSDSVPVNIGEIATWQERPKT